MTLLLIDLHGKFKKFETYFKGQNKFDVKLIKELLVIKVKPGLSAYANDPNRVNIIRIYIAGLRSRLGIRFS